MKKTYSSLVKFFALFRSRLPAYGLSSLIVSGRNFLLTWLTAFIGSEVIAAVETGAVANFGSRLLVFALILLLYALTDTLGLYLLGVTSQKIENDVRLGALRGVLFANFSKAQSLGGRGEILSRIDKDTGSAVGLLSGGFVTVAMFVISGVGATAVIARESLLVCGALYLLGVAGFFLQNYLSSQVKKLTKAQRESGSRAMSKFIQLLSRSADIKASGNCARGFALYGAEIENFRKISAKLSLISGISDGVSEAVLLIGFWGSLGFCVYRYYLGDGSLESAVMVSQMSSLVLTMTLSIYSMMMNLKGSSIGVERVLELSDLTPEDTSGEALYLEVEFEYLLRAVDAVCTFDNGTTLDYNCNIPKNRLVAIVGESGKGKSTLMRLMLKLYPVASGELILGEKGISVVSSRDVRNKTAFVPQETPAWGGTIREVVSFGITSAVDDEKIWQALSLAGAEKWVSELQMGLDSEVSDGGSNLSGGQRQMLAIAAAILQDREIIILDEVFSGMDENHINTVMQNLKKLSGAKSVLIVTHDKRVSSLCDVIVAI